MTLTARSLNPNLRIIAKGIESTAEPKLRKAGADLTVDRRPIALVNLETFKSHSYPDVLLSVLIATFREYAGWMRTAAINPATKSSFWVAFKFYPRSRAVADGR